MLDRDVSLHSAVPKALKCSDFAVSLWVTASVAQLAELLICNQPVVGSSPSAGSSEHHARKIELIWATETSINSKISVN